MIKVEDLPEESETKVPEHEPKTSVASTTEEKKDDGEVGKESTKPKYDKARLHGLDTY